MVNLKANVPGAPNFKYVEFIKSSTALRKGIDNIPTDQEWEKIEVLATNVLQKVRDQLGPINISSGFRSVELNIAIGGSENSNHCRAEAADIEPLLDNITLMDVVRYIYNNLEFRTIILEYPLEGWVHVDYREGGNIKRLRLKDKEHHYEDVSLEYLENLYG